MSFYSNSYYILDLNSNSTDKEILKKSKNTILKIKADMGIVEKIEFKLDLKIPRNEENINEATKKLTFPKKKLEEYFFWFQIENETDKLFIKFLEENNFNEAIKVQTRKIEQDDLGKFKYEKNLVLCYMYMLNNDYDEDILLRSINIWKKLIHNNIFWSDFFDNYKTKESGLISKDLIKEFKDEIENLILDEYKHIAKLYPKYKIFDKVIKNFSPTNSALVLKYVESYIIKTKAIIEKISKLDFEDGIIPENKKNKISEMLEELKEIFNYFERLGLENETSVQILADEVAKNLENLSININNKTKDYEVSYKILKIALKFVESNSIKKGIQDNLNIIIQNREFIAMNTILELIKNSKFASALTSIDYLLNDKNTSEESRKILKDIKIKISVRKDLDKTLMKNSPVLFDISGFGLMLYGSTRFITFFFFPVCPVSSYNIINNYDGTVSFLGEKELGILFTIWRFIFIIAVLAWILN